MAASSLIGSVYYDASTSSTAVTMDNTSYTLFTATMVEEANNVGWGNPRNNGIVKNDTGAEQVIDGLVIVCMEPTTGTNDVAMIPMTSSDNITYTEVSTDFQIVREVSTVEKAMVMRYTLTAPIGEYIGVGFKNLDVDVDGNCFSYTHFVRSRDGGDAPTLQGLTSTFFDGATTTITISSTGVFVEAGLTTATVGSLTTGLTDNNDGSFTNNTGETLVVDGEILMSSRAATSQHLQAITAGIDTGSGLAQISGTGAGACRQTTTPPNFFGCTYTVSMDDGDTIAPMVANLTGTQNNSAWGLQHFIRSRT